MNRTTQVAFGVLALVLGSICVSATAPTTKIKIIRPSNDVAVPAGMLQKLHAADARAFSILPNRAAVLVYDTVRDTGDAADSMDNIPHIAVFSSSGKVVLDMDSQAPTGPVKFDGLAVMPVLDGTPLLVCAFTLGVDGSGTFFVFIGQQNGSYKVLATMRGAQAQIRFSAKSPQHFELWTADEQFSRDPDQQCVWCLKHYKASTYVWSNWKIKLLAQSKTKKGYKPESFDGARFVVE